MLWHQLCLTPTGLSVSRAAFFGPVFTAFFLRICIAQVAFMEDLMHPARLRDRILIWAIRAGALPSKSEVTLRAVTIQGELTRAVAVDLLSLTAFPTKLAGRWMPGLFPGE